MLNLLHGNTTEYALKQKLFFFAMNTKNPVSKTSSNFHLQHIQIKKIMLNAQTYVLASCGTITDLIVF